MSAITVDSSLVGAGAPARRRGKSINPGVGITLALVIGGLPAVAVALLALTGHKNTAWFLALAGLTAALNLAIVLTDVRFGLALFIACAGMSPKLPGIYDNLRIEDLIFVMVFAVWVGRTVQGGQLPAIRAPFLVPFAALALVSILSSMYGLTLGYIPDWKYAIFLQLKRLEYLIIFFVVATSVKDEQWLRALCVLFVVSGAIASGYGLANQESSYDQSVADTRVSGPKGENYNTLAGYLVICIGAGLALMPEIKASIPRLLLIGAIGISGAALLLSFSREGYIMLMGSLIVFGFTKHRVILLGAVVALVAAGLLAAPIRDNVTNTARTIQTAKHDDPGANSLTARLKGWEWRLNTKFWKEPVFGCGVGSTMLSVDNEYVLRLCEVGTVGFAVFLWFLASVGDMLRRLMRAPGLVGCLALGASAGFVGMLIQGMAATSFNTIRTMEPFWFLLGLMYTALLIRRRQRTAELAAAAEAAAAAPARRPTPMGAVPPRAAPRRRPPVRANPGNRHRPRVKSMI